MEIDERSYRDVKKAEMREQLRFIHRMQRFFAFAFAAAAAFYDQVCSEATIHLDTLVDKRNRFLTFHPKSNLFQFTGKAGFVRRFQQTRPKAAVNLDRCSNYVGREILRLHAEKPLTAEIAKITQRAQRKM